MSDAIWIEPAMAGVVFGVLFGLAFPRLLRWMAGGGTGPYPGGLMTHALTGAGAGILFAAALLLDKLVEAGSVGPVWSWVQFGIKAFGGIAILGGVVMIAVRLLRGRT